MRSEYKKFKSEENSVIDIITKIRNNEEVEIPLVAFEYIYRNIDNISVVKDGKVVIINDEIASKAKKLLKKKRRVTLKNLSMNQKEQKADILKSKKLQMVGS